jgi:hypothetical protein
MLGPSFPLQRRFDAPPKNKRMTIDLDAGSGGALPPPLPQ